MLVKSSIDSWRLSPELFVSEKPLPSFQSHGFAQMPDWYHSLPVNVFAWQHAIISDWVGFERHSLRDAMTELMSTVNDSLLEISGDPEYALHMFSSFTPYRLDAEATWDRAAQAREGRRPPAARRGAGKVPNGGGWGCSRRGFPPSTLRPTAHSGAVAAVRLVQ
jgi:hypothetical protein